MNDSQKLLIARVMLQLNKSFANMSLQQQAEVAQALNQRLERQILGAHNLEEFNSVIANEQRAADKSEADYKRRKAAYEQEVAAAEAAAEATKAQSTETPAQSTAEQEAVAPTETNTDSSPTTDA